MKPDAPIHLLGYACGIGAAKAGTELGPETLWRELSTNSGWSDFVTTDIFCPEERAKQLAATPILAEINTQLGSAVQSTIKSGERFIAVGGDHTMAIGTWSGAAAVFGDQQIGLIWVDAHLDSHTPETTPSKNIHGMPLAILLGHGDEQLTHLFNTESKLQPENVCIIGVRSYEPEELALLQSLNVRIIFMDEIKKRGFARVWQEALEHVQKNTAAFGVSIDIDAIDPDEAPGTGAQEANGLHADDIILALQTMSAYAPCIGIEIAEFNPTLDVDNRTLTIAEKLVQSFKTHSETENEKHR